MLLAPFGFIFFGQRRGANTVHSRLPGLESVRLYGKTLFLEADQSAAEAHTTVFVACDVYFSRTPPPYQYVVSNQSYLVNGHDVLNADGPPLMGIRS
jgi:hypothetical protein